LALDRLNKGDGISGISAILLFAFTFFHWYGVKAVNTSNLLFAVQAGGPGKSAWEALDYTPIFLLLTVVVTLAVVALRLANAPRGPRVPLNAVVMIFGVASVLLILYRIVDPPVFSVERPSRSKARPSCRSSSQCSRLPGSPVAAAWPCGMKPARYQAEPAWGCRSLRNLHGRPRIAHTPLTRRGA
jgi:hypothetical protein